MSEQSETRFVLAVHNTLLGVFNYLVFNLPSKWKLKSGDFPFEMYASTKIGEVRWVRDGISVNYIYDGESALRMVVSVHENERQSKLVKRNVTVLRDESIDINGHRGRVVIGRTSRGLLKKTQLDYLRIVYRCNVTRRTIDLAMEGRCHEESLKTLTEAIQKSTCH